jgi:hypothetical protein
MSMLVFRLSELQLGDLKVSNLPALFTYSTL